MSKKRYLPIDYGIIGKRISIARKEQRITQEALAKTCEVSVTHLSHIENGGSSSLETLIRLCVYLQVSMDDAFGISSYQKPILQDCLDLFQSHSFDEQQIAMYVLQTFFTALDIMREVKRSKRLEDVLRAKHMDFTKLPDIKLYEEHGRLIMQPRKQGKTEAMAADDIEPIKLPSRNKKK